MLMALGTIVIEDNNPNILFGIVLILAAVYIIFAFLEIASNNKRKKRLIQLRKKIVARHGLIEEENNRRANRARKMAKNSGSN